MIQHDTATSTPAIASITGMELVTSLCLMMIIFRFIHLIVQKLTTKRANPRVLRFDGRPEYREFYEHALNQVSSRVTNRLVSKHGAADGLRRMRERGMMPDMIEALQTAMQVGFNAGVIAQTLTDTEYEDMVTKEAIYDPIKAMFGAAGDPARFAALIRQLQARIANVRNVTIGPPQE